MIGDNTAAERRRFEARWNALGKDELSASLLETRRQETFGSAETLGAEAASKAHVGSVIGSALGGGERVSQPPGLLKMSVRGGLLLPRLSLSTGGLDGEAPIVSSEGVDLTLVRPLGQGGMGAVYLAHQRSLDRSVAVKITHPHAPTSAALALIHEGRLAGSLEHPNIVPVHALGLDDTGRPILVVKRIEGVSWSELVADENHPFWSQVVFRNEDRLLSHLEILMQVCNALHLAHSRGIVHRDVKPDNVMIGEYGEVYLVDWGVAKRLSDGSGGQSDTIVGTPAYMAPEMVHGEASDIDARTDVYLLGSTLHEILTGKPPHAKATLYDALLAASASEPLEYPEDAPAELVVLCRAAMARNQDERPASAKAFREEIAAFLRHRTSLALTTAACEKLEALKAKLAAGAEAFFASAEVFAALSECRFGFMQALVDWPDSARAKEGLSRCVGLMLEREIVLENPANARALLSQLEGDRRAFEERIEAVEQKLLSRRRIEEDAARMAHEMDEDVGRRARTIFVSLVLGIGSMAMSFMALREASTRRPAPWSDVLGFDALTVSLLVAGLIFGRKKLLTNLYNRRLLWTLTAGFSMSALNDVLCSLHGVHVWTAGAIGQIIVGACLVVAAINTRRALLAPAAVQIIAGIGSFRVPWATGAIGTLAIVATVFLILRTSRRGDSRNASA